MEAGKLADACRIAAELLRPADPADDGKIMRGGDPSPGEKAKLDALSNKGEILDLFAAIKEAVAEKERLAKVLAKGGYPQA